MVTFDAMTPPTTKTEEYRLSVDEVAFAIAQVGDPNLARHLLLSQAGDSLTAEAIEGRLMAAGHSLLARHLIDVDEASTVQVTTPFADAIQPLIKADFSIYVSSSNGRTELAQTYHFAGERIVRQVIDREIVYELASYPSADVVIDDCLNAVFARDAGLFDVEASRLPASVLDDLQQTADPSEVERILTAAGMPADARSLFAEDFQKVVARGSVIRVDFPAAPDVPTSNEGILVLRGPDRLWLMRIVQEGDSAALLVAPGSAEDMSSEIKRIIATSR